MAGRIYIHVGLQKTGTSYLQGILFASLDALAEQGVAIVPSTKRRTFWLMLDVRGRYRSDFDPPAVARSLDDFAAAVATASSPRVLLSEESLAPASDDQIARLLAACGEREVHLVVTLRDLARQIPSAWQEALKAGADDTFEAYLEKLRLHQDEPGHPLWRQKDVVALLGAWTRRIPGERVHLVTVPPAGSDPALLLQRFCEVLGVDAERLDREVLRKNEGLKHVGAEVLRRVNEQLAPTHRKRDVYGDVGKRYLSTSILAQQEGRRIEIPDEYRDWTRSVSLLHVDYLAAQDFDVVGDLADLVPDAESFSSQPSGPSEAEVAAAATAALAVVIGDEMDRRRTVRAGRKTPEADQTAATPRLLARLRRRVRR